MSRSFYSYVCPFCDAYDSTKCDKLPPLVGDKPYTEKQLDEAREVGCRVAYYIDADQAERQVT